MILSQEKILRLVGEKNLLERFNTGCLEGAGYDLRVGRFYQIKGSSHLSVDHRHMPEVEEIQSNRITLKPGDYLLIETLEKVNMPDNLVARILPRSTVFRCGCSLITAVVDPGYKGSLTLGLKNLSGCEFTLEKEARVGQIVFEEITGETKQYNGRYQGGRVV